MRLLIGYTLALGIGLSLGLLGGGGSILTVPIFVFVMGYDPKLAVAICALIVRGLPKLRVAMWTCPIILLTAQPSAPMTLVALHRGSEVILRERRSRVG